jgi:uncharacterized protein (TIGR03437 family)
MNRAIVERCIGRAFALIALLGCAANVPAQSPSAQAGPTSHPGQPLALDRAHYRLRAGERVSIMAPQETLDFIRTAKNRVVRIGGEEGRGFSVGPSRKSGEVLLAASLTMKPGEYALTVATVSPAGEERTAAIDVTLNPLQSVPSTSSVPPVILLNGWQLGLSSNGCPPSQVSDTFGSTINEYLQPDNVPVVYFFDNCVEDQNGLIEELGYTLGLVLNLIRYDTGTQVPQVDLIAHSMGGLIVRSYLAGLQSGSAPPSPPSNPRIRKFVQIATPNFGSFQATDLLGSQTAEMIPGSAFLWNLATWNQRGDDLRGVDTLAIIGNGGTFGNISNASDGVVSLTSASLGFARDPSRTLILPYCHIDTTSGWGAVYRSLGKVTCDGYGIADVYEVPQTGAIIQSFLANTTYWMSIRTTPTVDPWLSQYGGIYFAEETSADQWITDTSAKVSFGSNVSLTAGGATGTVFYNEFIRGTDTFLMTGTSFGACGPFTEPVGYYTTLRCKFSPQIFSVGPLLAGVSGNVVQSNGSITISGSGFGQLCSSCAVFAYPGPVALQVSSWTDSTISAVLPGTFSNELVQLVVQATAGADSINIMAQAQAQPSIALSPAQLQFSYTVGSALPAAQTVAVSNSAGGTFTWSAAPSASWLTLSSATGLLTVSINPTALSPNTYTGTITITGTGAANSPQTVSVTLIVTAATTPPPTISLSGTQASFTYIAGGAVPQPQTISISNSGSGILSWSATSNHSWLSVTPSGTAPSTLAISTNPIGLTVGSYTGAISLAATGATNNPQTISVALTVSAATPTAVVTSVSNAASSSSGPIAPGEIVAIKGSGLGPATGVSFSVDPITGMVDTTLSGTRVFFGAFPAPILYASAGQVNAIVPYEIAGQSQVVMEVQNQGVSSAGTTLLLQVASAAPGLFTFNSTGAGPAAALNQDGSLNGPSNPAADGSYVTLYFTGGGQTNAAGVTGSITGSVLKWLVQNVTVTVGGQPATVAFDGAAPTFIDGFLQLNVRLPTVGVHGTVPVVISVGAILTPATATLAVQ